VTKPPAPKRQPRPTAKSPVRRRFGRKRPARPGRAPVAAKPSPTSALSTILAGITRDATPGAPAPQPPVAASFAGPSSPASAPLPGTPDAPPAPAPAAPPAPAPTTPAPPAAPPAPVDATPVVPGSAPPPVGPWPAAFPPVSATPAAPGGVPLSTDPVLHLLRRVTGGATPGLVAEVRAQGVGAWLDRQLAPETIDDSAVEAAVQARWPALATSALDARATVAEFSWDLMVDLQRATLLRMATSRAQLAEVMVDFWSQHLNVTCPSDKVWSTRHVYDREVIRPHALGSFRDMLRASAQSPAMLAYLDNAVSRGRAPNENYGRELLELHTVGVEAGYSEAEVRSSALALTGFSVSTDGSDLFSYKPGYRYVGPVSVLGWSSPNATATGGLEVGLAYLDHLARHPSTAQRIARKLAVRFVSDAPPQALVDRLAATYLAADTQVVPVLRVLLASDEFWASAGQKLRRPLEWVVAGLRTLGAAATADAAVGGWEGLCWRLGDLGQAPLAWAPPNGYPDVAAAWLSTAGTLGRWNLAVALVDRWWPEGIAQPDSTWQALIGDPRPANAQALVDRLCLRLLGQLLPAAHRDALVTFFGGTPTGAIEDWRLTYRVTPLAQLVLSSPVWSLR